MKKTAAILLLLCGCTDTTPPTLCPPTHCVRRQTFDDVVDAAKKAQDVAQECINILNSRRARE